MWRPVVRPRLLQRIGPRQRTLVSSSHTAPPTAARRWFHSPWTWTKLLVAGALGGHLFASYLYSLDSTWGISMLPHMAADGDVVLVSKYYRHGRGVQVGDLVSFVHPVDDSVWALKRVIGVEGDFVLRDSPHRGRGDMMIQVPAGHCYVVGDNLDHSRDSRMWGPLPMALIRGKALCKISGKHWYAPWPQPIGQGMQDPVKHDMDVD